MPHMALILWTSTQQFSQTQIRGLMMDWASSAARTSRTRLLRKAKAGAKGSGERALIRTFARLSASGGRRRRCCTVCSTAVFFEGKGLGGSNPVAAWMTAFLQTAFFEDCFFCRLLFLQTAFFADYFFADCFFAIRAFLGDMRKFLGVGF